MQVVFSPGAEIKFEGANNFRELGGYRAADGRQCNNELTTYSDFSIHLNITLM